jgi:hypothetical protein
MEHRVKDQKSTINNHTSSIQKQKHPANLLPYALCSMPYANQPFFHRSLFRQPPVRTGGFQFLDHIINANLLRIIIDSVDFFEIFKTSRHFFYAFQTFQG